MALAALFCLTVGAIAQPSSPDAGPATPAASAPATAASAPTPAAEIAAPTAPRPLPAAETPPAARAIGGHTKPTGELSAWSMFMDADILVKAVMLGLAFASVLTWTVFLAKSAELFLSGRRLKASIREVEDCASLGEAQVRFGRQRHVTAVLVQQAAQEARLSSDIPGDAGLRERVASRFADVQKTEGRLIRRGMGILATIGSTSPFVGLFGTVWGIMNSFIGIAKSQTTNLAVVAPGIAEALLATAIGLVAAIPAVIVYNHFARLTKGHMEAVSRAAGVVGRLLSRDLDRARGRPLAHAAE